METLEAMLLRRPRPGPLNQSGSVMASPSSPGWQPEYEKEPPLEQVSPEDFIPNPKTVVAALKGLPLAAGTIIGKGSQLWKPTHAAAASMNLRAGANPEGVWKQGYGVLPAPNTPEIVSEISDAGAKYVANPNATKLGDVLRHPELYKHYPWLKDYGFQYDKGIGGLANQQSYIADPSRGIIRLNPDKIVDDEGALSSLLHEGAHGIQNFEGWIPGTSMKYTPSKIGAIDPAHAPLLAKAASVSGVNLDPNSPALDTMQRILRSGSLYGKEQKELAKLFIDTKTRELSNYKQAHKIYSDTHGEAMARLVQARKNLPKNALREMYPFEPDLFKQATGSAINELRKP